MSHDLSYFSPFFSSKRCFLLFLAIFSFVPFYVLAQDRRVTIGYITDTTGKAAYYGKYSALGAKMAEEDLRLSGGHLSVILEENDLKPQRAVTAAQKLLHTDHVEAIISEFSPTTLPISPIVKNYPVLFLGISAAASFLKDNPHAFKSYLDFQRGCRDIAAYWKLQGIVRIGHLKLISESGELCAEGIRAVFPNVQTEEFLSGTDVSAQVLRLRTKGVDAVLSPAYEGDTVNLLKALKNISWTPYLGFDARHSFSANVAKEFSDLSSRWIGFGFVAASGEFTKKVRQRISDISDTGIEAAALSYIHTTQVFEALVSCPLRDIDCAIQHLEASTSNDILQFQGWENRVAQFKFHLFQFREGVLANARDT